MIEFTAEVLDIRQENRHTWHLLLDRTRFSAAACTGHLAAVAQSGARIVVPVLSVIEEGTDLWHRVQKPLAAGTLVSGSVDEAAPHSG